MSATHPARGTADPPTRPTLRRRVGKPPKERSVQREIVRDLRRLGLRVIAIPNGQKLAGSQEQRVRMAAALRQEGLVAGFPDCLVYRPGLPPISGLIEVKREGARLTGDHATRQLECHEALRRDGWKVGIVRSLADAIDLVTEWGML